MRLGIDLDGVVCDFNAGWMRLHMAEFGSELKPEMVVSWDNLHELGGFADMPAFWRWAQGNADRPSIFRHLEPYPEALETLHALRDAGTSHRHPHGEAALGDPRHAALDRRPRAADGRDPHPLPQVPRRVRRLPRRLADRVARSGTASPRRGHLPDDQTVERSGRGSDRYRRLACLQGVRREALTCRGNRSACRRQLC